jgi:peptidoglycan/xylan/chitin deacetylase (PgdA/CDA1 family)
VIGAAREPETFGSFNSIHRSDTLPPLNRSVTVLSTFCAMLLLLAGIAHAGAASALDQPQGPARVAITIDDIPDHGDLVSGFNRAKISADIIKALKDNGVVSAYGFTNGTFMDDDPREISILKYWLAAGYPLGNHTYHHPDLTKTSARSFIADIAKQDKLLLTLAPFSPLIQKRHVFRYPYLDEGNTLAKRNAVRAYLAKHGYRIGQVTADYFDWAWTDAFTRCTRQHNDKQVAWLKENIIVSADRHLRGAQASAKLLFNRDIAQILLIHVGVFDAIMLDRILKHWRAQGVQFISLDEAIADPAYAINPNVVYDDGRDFLAQIAMARKVNIDPFVDSAYTIDNLNQICPEKAAAP